jgi:predicted neutral ceramidase superfamily lipid hydrolase
MNESIRSFRGEMKKSCFKIWLRAGLFVIFSTLFTFYFFRDTANGYFTWTWTALLFTLCVPIGSWMSRIVPMQVDESIRAVTLSFDRTYFILIWLLVIAKLVASRIPSLITASDVIMCVILGVMFGRLGGIGLRVRQLKTQHGFFKKQP